MVRSDEETGQTIISGMGELHLEVLVDRMLREFRVQARVGKPAGGLSRVDHRARCAKLDYRYVKQTGGRGQYGHVVLALEPGEPGSGIVFENAIVGGSIPREFIPAVEKGVREAAEGGIDCWLSGNGYQDPPVSMALSTKSTRTKWPSKWPASMAFKEGAQKAGPILQEPIMKVEVVVPEEFLGDIMGQLNARRGEIQGMEVRPGNAQAVACHGAAGRNVWLCHRSALGHPGTGRLYDGI